MRAVAALAVLASLLGSCLFSQSQNCGEAYERHLVRWQDGRYRFAQPPPAGDPLAGVQSLAIARAADGRSLTITTDDGRTDTYRVVQ